MQKRRKITTIVMITCNIIQVLIIIITCNQLIKNSNNVPQYEIMHYTL